MDPLSAFSSKQELSHCLRAYSFQGYGIYRSAKLLANDKNAKIEYDLKNNKFTVKSGRKSMTIDLNKVKTPPRRTLLKFFKGKSSKKSIENLANQLYKARLSVTPVQNTITSPVIQALPLYAHSFLQDPAISSTCKDLFKLLFVELINPANIRQLEPLGKNLIPLMKQKLVQFNENYLKEKPLLHLGCRGSKAHANNKDDPWQTIKITAPNIQTVGTISQILVDLNNGLHKHYGIQSGGGYDYKSWLELGDRAKGLKKGDPTCFEGDRGGKKIIMNPQLQLSLIDIERIIGVIPSEDLYFQKLRGAYG